MTFSRTGCLLFGAALAFGFWFRVYGLDQRPMHADEAVHAVKLGELVDEGFYAYNPDEFHGPTLNYFTLVIAGLRGQTTGEAITETTLEWCPRSSALCCS